MRIGTALTLTCDKQTVGKLSGNFYAVGGMKNIAILDSAGLQTTHSVTFATKIINLRVKFLLRSPLATIFT